MVDIDVSARTGMETRTCSLQEDEGSVPQDGLPRLLAINLHSKQKNRGPGAGAGSRMMVLFIDSSGNCSSLGAEKESFLFHVVEEEGKMRRIF